MKLTDPRTVHAPIAATVALPSIAVTASPFTAIASTVATCFHRLRDAPWSYVTVLSESQPTSTERLTAYHRSPVASSVHDQHPSAFLTGLRACLLLTHLHLAHPPLPTLPPAELLEQHESHQDWPQPQGLPSQ